MLTPKYISPSSLACFESSPETYYLRYFCGAASDPTTPAMAAGTGFDCFVKSHIMSVTGSSGPGLDEMLVAGCTDRRRGVVVLEDWARESGAYLFERYRLSGALSRLLMRLERRTGAIRFESGVTSDIGGVPVFGKPDMFWADSGGGLVMLDWKVNGIMGSGLSPNKGYCWEWPSGKTHKLAVDMMGRPALLEELCSSWADQLGIYAMALLGSVPEAARCTYCIEQIVGTGSPSTASRVLTVPRPTGMPAGVMAGMVDVPFLLPEVRVASFVCRIGEDYLTRLVERIRSAWSVISFGPDHPLFETGRLASLARSDASVGFMF
jgi:hypothetical protein